MDEKRIHAALALWREVPEHAYALDAEIVQAFCLRDELETASLDIATEIEITVIDSQVQRNASDIVAAMRQTGALPAVHYWREKEHRTYWWWWLDGRPST